MPRTRGASVDAEDDFVRDVKPEHRGVDVQIHVQLIFQGFGQQGPGEVFDILFELLQGRIDLALKLPMGLHKLFQTLAAGGRPGCKLVRDVEVRVERLQAMGRGLFDRVRDKRGHRISVRATVYRHFVCHNIHIEHLVIQ